MIYRLPYAFKTYFFSQRQIVQHKFPKNARNFKRNRGETKIENETIQTPFTNLPVTTGPVPLTKLWKPLGFTIAVSKTFRINYLTDLYNINI